MFARFAAQRRGGFDEQPEDDGAIVAGELDQLARSLAALHLPGPRVMPRPLRLKPIAGLHRSPMRRSRSG